MNDRCNTSLTLANRCSHARHTLTVYLADDYNTDICFKLTCYEKVNYDADIFTD